MFYEDQEQREILLNKLLNKEFFALNRFGEGEIRVIMSGGTGGYLRCIAKNSIREWEYNPKEDKYLYEELCKSFYYQNDNYLKVSVRGGKKNHIEFVEKSLPNEKFLATDYFYSDEYYKEFFEKYIPLFKEYDSINFLCSNSAEYQKIEIPFKKVYNKFEISNAWKQKEYMEEVSGP